jgi:ribonuclease HI
LSQRRITPATWLPRVPIRQLVVYVDGSSVPNPGPSGFGLLVLARSDAADWLFGCIKSTGFGGNNQAEFLGLVAACDLAREAKASSALIMSDSTVGLGLITGQLRSAGAAHRRLQERTAAWLSQSASTGLCWVPRRRNLAHHLARAAAELREGGEAVNALGRSRSQIQRLLALAG